MSNQYDNFTLLALHGHLTEMWANYELVVHWRFTKEGNEYEIKWRPEGNLGLLSDFPVEVTAPTLERAVEETMHRSTEWLAQVREARDLEENGPQRVREDRLL